MTKKNDQAKTENQPRQHVPFMVELRLLVVGTEFLLEGKRYRVQGKQGDSVKVTLLREITNRVSKTKTEKAWVGMEMLSMEPSTLVESL